MGWWTHHPNPKERLMALDIKSWNKDRIIYKVVPETISDAELTAYNNKNKEDSETAGWTKDRSLRKAGEIPMAFLYNYAISKGIKSTGMWEFFKADKFKEMKRLLNEFPEFRCGNKFEVRG
jgi:hypothetical protein